MYFIKALLYFLPYLACCYCFGYLLLGWVSCGCLWVEWKEGLQAALGFFIVFVFCFACDLLCSLLGLIFAFRLRRWRGLLAAIKVEDAQQQKDIRLTEHRQQENATSSTWGMQRVRFPLGFFFISDCLLHALADYERGKIFFEKLAH